MERNHMLKTVLISALVTTNILVWYEIFGIKFLLLVILLTLIVVLTSKVNNG